MSRHTVGARVGAILGSSEDPKEVQVFGYGTYVGERVPAEAIGWIASMLREEGAENPCIELDSGAVVYGCECWWGTEDQVKKRLARHEADGYRIVDVEVDAYRAAWRAEAAAEAAEADAEHGERS